MLKKIFRGIINTVSILLILLSIFIMFNVIMTNTGKQPSVAGYSMFRVVSGSMEPEIMTNDVVIVKQTDPAAIAEGDVISFYSRDKQLQGAVNTHRVIEVVTEENGSYYFRTKGDANIREDEYPVYPEDLIGIVVRRSHAVGLFVKLVSNPLIFAALVIIPLIIVVVTNLRDMVKIAKSVAADEVAEAERLAKKRREELSEAAGEMNKTSEAAEVREGAEAADNIQSDKTED